MMEPFFLKVTNLILEMEFSLIYPTSFATLNTSAAVLALTPFLWFRALDTVAGENPVNSLMYLILAFIPVSSHTFILCCPEPLQLSLIHI